MSLDSIIIICRYSYFIHWFCVRAMLQVSTVFLYADRAYGFALTPPPPSLDVVIKALQKSKQYAAAVIGDVLLQFEHFSGLDAMH
jgi:hypothetical protein